MRHFTQRALATALCAVALTACREDPQVGERRQQQPAAVAGPAIEIFRAQLATASDGSSTVTAFFRVTDAGLPVPESEVQALAPAWTLAALETEPVSGEDAWRSYVLTGATNAALPVAGPGTPAEHVLADARQPGSESDGALVDLGAGTYTYRFSATLPATFDRSRTVRIGAFLRGTPGTKTTTATLDFVPSGGPLSTRELILDEGCATCHGTLRAHGGERHGTRICVTCHTFQHADPETVDPAAPSTATAATNPNPLELGRLAHRIHRGKNLPTLYNSTNTAPVPALPLATGTPPLPFSTSRLSSGGVTKAVAGRKFSVVGVYGRERKFGYVDTRTEGGQPATGPIAFGISFPRDYRSCVVCHPAAAKDAARIHTEISRRNCSGCHVDVWWETDTAPDVVHFPHTGGVQADDTKCAGCHVASDGTSKVYAKLADVHVAPVESPRFNKPVVEIVSVSLVEKTGTDGVKRKHPVVVFTLSDRNGPITSLGAPTPEADQHDPPSPVLRRFGTPPALHDLTRMSGVSITLAQRNGPDYGSGFEEGTQKYLSESIPLCDDTPPVPASTEPCRLNVTDVEVPGPNGPRPAFRHEMKTPLPVDATGTWLVAVAGRRSLASPAPYYDNASDSFPWPSTGESVSEAADNALAHFLVSEGAYPGAATPRREIVDVQKCSKCHLRLSGHGGSRNQVELCAACHTHDRTDWEGRPKDTGTKGPTGNVVLSKTYDGIEERSLQFKRMIHRTHTGGRRGPAELSAIAPYAIYSGGGALTNISARFRDRGEFPNDLANCLLCHVEGAFLLESIPEDAAATHANETAAVLHVQGTARPENHKHPEDEPGVPPGIAACGGCHATAYSAYHMGKYQPKDCVGCHGANGVSSVRKVHGLTPPPAETPATP